jgi:hypothetical protein
MYIPGTPAAIGELSNGVRQFSSATENDATTKKLPETITDS